MSKTSRLPPDSDQFDEDMIAFGLKEELDDRPDVDEDEKNFDIWPENRTSLLVFLALSTQWHQNADGVRTGIRYEAIPAVERYMPKIPKPRWPRNWQHIRIMENAALEVIHTARQRQLADEEAKRRN